MAARANNMQINNWLSLSLKPQEIEEMYHYTTGSSQLNKFQEENIKIWPKKFYMPSKHAKFQNLGLFRYKIPIWPMLCQEGKILFTHVLM
jgi:hypothetical protein